MFDDTDRSSLQRNVLGTPLVVCSMQPKTGFFRTGCCHTGPEDLGLHVVCAVMTAEFLAFSAAVGNDLSTPMPEIGFHGLKPGDRWCLCGVRWKQALDAGAAPLIILTGTHEAMLQLVDLDTLMMHAVDVS